MVDYSKLHFLIKKQLKRANLNENDISPDKQQAWNDFLARISNTYFDQEQDRYLLERSMEISSREMMELNDKLEFAQKIAHLGYWFYDQKENKLMWSKETFHLAGIDPAEGIPPFEEVMQLVHEEDRPKIEACMQRAFTEGKDYEIELRFKNKKEGKYYWHYAKGHPHVNVKENVNDVGPVRYLSGIAIDITERKIAEENLKKMHQQLLSISRQAGMAEVATSVLHNIGNILNSANVSISLLIELLTKSHIDKLIKIADLIKEHLNNKDDYLTNDQNGKLIPDYLAALANDISQEHCNISNEINNIDNHLNHIKDVVALQKDISGVAGVKENITLHEIIDLAIQMGCSSGDAKEIQIIKNFQYMGPVLSERAKLLQILVNLIRNARDSVTLFQNQPKQIIISIKQIKKASVIITVQDSGGGISHENLTRIFSLGFTTKPNGHGFGLHSSAIAAKELGGKLKAESGGVGKGATFTIELPLEFETAVMDSLS